MSLEVTALSGLTLVQDLGRAPMAGAGIGRSGAADRTSFALGQRLVGNSPEAAALETLIGPLELRCAADCVIAITGAVGRVRIAGRQRERNRALRVRAGEAVTVGPAEVGARLYTSVRGGVDVPPVLGSRSRDTLGGIGPEPLRPGDVLPVGAAAASEAWFEVAPAPEPLRLLEVALDPGPHDDMLDGDGWRSLQEQLWTVAIDSDRAGVRLDGRPLPAPSGDLASFPVIPGSVQLPPHGNLIVLGPDAGVTGGYPVIAVATDASQDALGQARPGTRVRLGLR